MVQMIGGGRDEGIGGGAVGSAALLCTVSPPDSLSWAQAVFPAPDPPAVWEGVFEGEGRGEDGAKTPAQVCGSCSS